MKFFLIPITRMRFILIITLLFYVASCGEDTPPSEKVTMPSHIVLEPLTMADSLSRASPVKKRTDTHKTGGQLTSPDTVNADRYINKGDLAEIKKRGKLRYLQPNPGRSGFLPRRIRPEAFELNLILKIADAIGVEVENIFVEKHKDLIPFLLAGKADVIGGNLTITPARRKKAAFTQPIKQIHEQVVVRTSEKEVRSIADLSRRSIAVRRSSSYWGTLAKLKPKYPKLRIQTVNENIDTLSILAGVAEKNFDLTVADDNIVSLFRSYNPGVRPAFNLSGAQKIAFAVRPRNTQLLEALNRQISKLGQPDDSSQSLFGDWQKIRQRKTLRIITRNSASTYFIWRGEILGFEYELARKFADRHHLRLEVIVPTGRDDLIPWLQKGRGDIVAAALTANPARATREKVSFSRSYHKVSEILVARSSEKHLKKLPDISNRSVVVRKSSSYWHTLLTLQKNSGVKFNLIAAPETLETEEIIAKVASGEYDLTVADSHILDIELTWRNDIKGAFALGEPVRHGWAVLPKNKKLLAAINTFFDKEYRGTFYNMTVDKYFHNRRSIKTHVRFRAKHRGELSPYDAIVKKHASDYRFDWRMIVAQMFQESRFDPQARSFAGAVGLMQVMPKTGKSMGFHNLREPSTGIHAGVKYLDWLRRYFDIELDARERNWFLLASYNVGAGHVADARRLARQKGLDPNIWFGNVEKSIRLLAKPAYARKARYGYCRGAEPVRYVREIDRRYKGYIKAVQHH